MVKQKYYYKVWKSRGDGKLIAEFLHSTDRDYCIELLKEKYEDCEFSREDTNK